MRFLCCFSAISCCFITFSFCFSAISCCCITLLNISFFIISSGDVDENCPSDSDISSNNFKWFCASSCASLFDKRDPDFACNCASVRDSACSCASLFDKRDRDSLDNSCDRDFPGNSICGPSLNKLRDFDSGTSACACACASSCSLNVLRDLGSGTSACTSSWSSFSNLSCSCFLNVLRDLGSCCASSCSCFLKYSKKISWVVINILII